MSKWKTYLKRAGGLELIKQYLRSGTFLTAVNQFLTLGRDKKALELLRLSMEYKFYKHLRKKYFAKAIHLKEAIDSGYTDRDSIPSNKVWICWWQGIENAPELVKRCYNSVRTNLTGKKIIVITKSNYSDYVSFPDYIIAKWESGVISNTHMSDILRLELLIRHGGMWMDATIFCTSGDIPKSISESELFFYQSLKPGGDGHTLLCSSWLLSAKANNRILLLTRELLYDYWSKATRLEDYFLFHHFLTLACEVYEEEYSEIPQFDNATPHIMLLNLFKSFDSDYWGDLCKLTCFHKLSYKLYPKLVENAKYTYYNHIMDDKYEFPGR